MHRHIGINPSASSSPMICGALWRLRLKFCHVCQKIWADQVRSHRHSKSDNANFPIFAILDIKHLQKPLQALARVIFPRPSSFCSHSVYLSWNKFGFRLKTRYSFQSLLKFSIVFLCMIMVIFVGFMNFYAFNHLHKKASINMLLVKS